MSSGFVDAANRTPVSYIVVIAYVAMAFATSPTEPSNQQLTQFGAASGVLLREGELWRLLGYAFLHGGLLHLGFNTWCLISFGPQLEHSVGSPRFTVIYAVSAIGGGVAGVLWSSYPQSLLVGGSGALFGIFGALLALGMRQGRHPLEFFSGPGARHLMTLLIVNLVIGFVVPRISNAAHIGGLIAGFALTFCFLERGRETADRTARVIQAGWIALLLALVLWCRYPVTRWDYLDQRRVDLQHDERGPAFARALLLRTDQLRTLPIPPEQRSEELRRIKAQAEGR